MKKRYDFIKNSKKVAKITTNFVNIIHILKQIWYNISNGLKIVIIVMEKNSFL
jgi:hypothetical protein